MAGNLVSQIAVSGATSKYYKAPETRRPIKYWDVHWVNKDHHCQNCGLHFNSRNAKKELKCPWCNTKLVVEKQPNHICKHCKHEFYRSPGQKMCPSCENDLEIKRGRPKKNETTDNLKIIREVVEYLK